MPPHQNLPTGGDGSAAECDPTGRAGMQERLRGDTAPLTQLGFDLSPLPQAVIASSGLILAANRAFRGIVGIEQFQEATMTIDSLLPGVTQLLPIGGRDAQSHSGAAVTYQRDGDLPIKISISSLAESSESGQVTLLALWPAEEMSDRYRSQEQDLGRERDARRTAEISVGLIERLLGITDVALAHIELHDLLNELLGRIRDVLQTDEASILLIDAGDNALSLRVSLHPDQLVRRPIRVPVGVGFAGRIAQTKQPLVLDDVTKYPFSNPAMLRRGVKSLMGVPMLVDDRVLGVIHVGMRTPRHFDKDELRLLELAAGRISLAIDRSNLFEAERQARAAAERAQQRDEFLARASETLVSSLDQQVTLNHATQTGVPVLGDICTVVLIGRDGIVRLVSATATNDLRYLIPQPGEKLPRPLDACPTIKLLVETGKSMLIEENIGEFFTEIAVSEDHLRQLRASSLTSALRVPLNSGGRAIGVITFCRTAATRRFTVEDVALTEDFAHLVALATDNTGNYLEAQHAIGARDEFISIASHELKTPLTTVKGYVQLLRRHLNEAVPDHERVQRTLGQLQDQVGRFEELVDELLDVSRIQSDRIRLNYERFDISYLVSQVVERVTQAYEQESPHTVDFPVHVPIWGSWDQSRIDQVVTNVLSNAFKYSPSGSTVTVEVEADEAQVDIKVSDAGIGIAADDIEMILQPFARGEGASRVAPGAGLGLYITNEIVARHGGSLSIESQPGVGSTFTIRLPRVTAELAES